MGGLIIGTGTMNLLFRNNTEIASIKTVLFVNIITHALGIAVDLPGIAQGVLQAIKMTPVELTHLFVGGGALLYLFKLKAGSK